MSYLGYKVHTLSFLNVPAFSVVSPICHHDKDYVFPLLNKGINLLNLHGFNLLADTAYDSSDLYDFVHLESESTSFIPLRASYKKPLVLIVVNLFLFILTIVKLKGISLEINMFVMILLIVL